jgi:hypoxanthine phosphoribosyltransferase
MSKELAQRVEESGFIPDHVIYIESAGILIGNVIAEYFGVVGTGIKISRSGNQTKDKLTNLLSILPDNIKLILRRIELKSGIHNRNRIRELQIPHGFNIDECNILIVDDSVDTGYTMKTMAEYLMKNAKGKQQSIKIASLNMFSSSSKVINTDFYLFRDHILIGPWSKDNPQYNQYKSGIY